MRPLLNPALRRAWRDGTTLQIGADPDRAVVIGGMDESCARLVDAMDGTREVPDVLARASELGLEPARARRLLDLLTAADVLTDAGVDMRPLAVLDRTERERLAPDLASLSLVRRGDSAVAALARRRAGTVIVSGLRRVGMTAAMLLAASGVGRVVPEDREPVRPEDVPAMGIDRSALGQRREDAVRAALARFAPATRTARTRRSPSTQLVILADVPDAHAAAQDLLRRGVAHLHVAVRETTGIVGPFVVPGRTACLRCQHLHRCDRDPAWLTVAPQLAGTRHDGRPEAPPCDTVLATAVATQAALQALAWIDGAGSTLPATADATAEIGLPDGRIRRRSWPAHPACGCQWSRTG